MPRPKRLTALDCMFRTDRVTMHPDQIRSIVDQGTRIEIHTYSDKPIVIPAEKDDDGNPIELEIYTLRWTEALDNSQKFQLQQYQDTQPAGVKAASGN